MTRLHIGSGSVYLAPGWVNIDLQGPHTFLAKNRPDLVEKWKTTEDDYYGKNRDKSVDSLRKGPLRQEVVCDVYGSLDNIPAAYWSVSAVLIRQVFEHLSVVEAHKALDQIDAVMQHNGVLTIDVPDHEETLRLYKETGDKFYVRHLLGPRNSDRGYHLCGYTRERLRALVEEHGFVYQADEPNIHLYPSISMRFVKPGPRAPRDYVKLPEMPASWKVLDIGPGAYPLERADVYLDYDIEKLTPLSAKGKSTILGDVMTKLERIPDKEFDFVWASHCFEHFSDPVAAAATVSRIGKRGCMVVPSAMKDGLFAHEERGHLWLCLPGPCECSPPVFVRSDPKYIDPLRDTEIQKISGRLWRTGPNRQEEARYLRQWFYRNEASLDVVVHWESELKIQVIG